MEQQPIDSTELGEAIHGLVDVGGRIMRLHRHPEVSGAMRGAPLVLRELGLAEGPLSPGELKRACGLTDARIANILRALEERGLVERRSQEADRRRVEVTLTERGRAEVGARREHVTAFMAALVRELGLADARELARILGRAADIMAAHAEDEPGACPMHGGEGRA
ncbi:MAG: MarR family transcriptional regulator [Collinsella sp.]|nr:MarR family transcriptional regulator [Collinsella sp.]